MRDAERGRNIGKGRSRLPAESPTQELIPGPGDHDLNQREMLSQLSHLGAPQNIRF